MHIGQIFHQARSKGGPFVTTRKRHVNRIICCAVRYIYRTGTYSARVTLLCVTTDVSSYLTPTTTNSFIQTTYRHYAIVDLVKWLSGLLTEPHSFLRGTVTVMERIVLSISRFRVIMSSNSTFQLIEACRVLTSDRECGITDD